MISAKNIPIVGILLWILKDKTEPYNSFGNGSAMRVSPVGRYAKTLEEAEEIAISQAQVSRIEKSAIEHLRKYI